MKKLDNVLTIKPHYLGESPRSVKNTGSALTNITSSINSSQLIKKLSNLRRNSQDASQNSTDRINRTLKSTNNLGMNQSQNIKLPSIQRLKRPEHLIMEVLENQKCLDKLTSSNRANGQRASNQQNCNFIIFFLEPMSKSIQKAFKRYK